MPPAPSNAWSSSCGNSRATSANGGGSNARPDRAPSATPAPPSSVSLPWSSRHAGHSPASAPAGRGFLHCGHCPSVFTLVFIASTRSLSTPEAFFGGCYRKSLKEFAKTGLNLMQGVVHGKGKGHRNEDKGIAGHKHLQDART